MYMVQDILEKCYIKSDCLWMDCKSVLSELHSGELIVFVDDWVYISYDCDVIKIDI
jgi:hypothetical protein